MNCWILQCNINHYRWIDQMKEHENDSDTWGIRHHMKKIEKGDTAFIWLTKYKEKETRGIYAMAKITGLPSQNIDKIGRKFAWQNQYWTDKEAKEHAKHLVHLELQYTKRIINKPILKDELEAAGLGNLLTVERYPRGIYKPPLKDCAIIRKLVETR